MILYESNQGQKLGQEQAAELGRSIFLCAIKYGQPISTLSAISLNFFSPLDVFWISIHLLLVPPVMGALFWLQAHLGAHSKKSKWILSSKGIKFCDGTFWLFPWSKIESLKFREITEVEGAYLLNATSKKGATLGGLILTQDQQGVLDQLKQIVPPEFHGTLLPEPESSLMNTDDQLL